MAIGGLGHQRLAGDDAAGAGAVVDHHGLAEALRDAACHRARGEVRDAAGGEGDEHADRAVGPPGRLRAGRADDWQRERGAEEETAAHHEAAQSAGT